jgi:hypothetical protein
MSVAEVMVRMSAEDTIKAGTEIAKKYGENEEIQRQNKPGRVEPTYYRVQLERDGSGWSGGWSSGRTR